MLRNIIFSFICLWAILANAADPKPQNNQIEKVSVQVTYKVGEPAPQYFTKQLNYKIVNIFDCKQNPDIAGTVKTTGINTTILMHEIHATGYPGSIATSEITCQVMR